MTSGVFSVGTAGAEATPCCLSESALSGGILVSAVGLNSKCSQELGKAPHGGFVQEEEKDFRSNSEK